MTATDTLFVPQCAKHSLVSELFENLASSKKIMFQNLASSNLFENLASSKKSCFQTWPLPKTTCFKIWALLKTICLKTWPL